MSLKNLKKDGIKMNNQIKKIISKLIKKIEFWIIGEEYKIFELYLEVVKRQGRALEFVPQKFKTYELCSEAVKNNKRALEYVPEKFQEQIKKQLGI
jgi:hypothetical protein